MKTQSIFSEFIDRNGDVTALSVIHVFRGQKKNQTSNRCCSCKGIKFFLAFILILRGMQMTSYYSQKHFPELKPREMWTETRVEI